MDFGNYRKGTSSKEIKSKIIFKRDNKNVKKPRHLKNPFFFLFLLYASKKIKIGPVQYEREDTDVVVSLAKKSKEYISSKFRTY